MKIGDRVVYTRLRDTEPWGVPGALDLGMTGTIVGVNDVADFIDGEPRYQVRFDAGPVSVLSESAGGGTRRQVLPEVWVLTESLGELPARAEAIDVIRRHGGTAVITQANVLALLDDPEVVAALLTIDGCGEEERLLGIAVRAFLRVRLGMGDP